MVYTVYIDEVFAVNMAMDLMVLMAVNQVLCYRAGAAQIVRGAALGAAWACVTAIFPQMPLTFKAAGTYGAAGAAMAVAAFKVKGIKEISRAAAGIYLGAVILGGSFFHWPAVLRYWGYRICPERLCSLEAQHPFLGRSAGLEDLQRPCCKERPCAG